MSDSAIPPSNEDKRKKLWVDLLTSLPHMKMAMEVRSLCSNRTEHHFILGLKMAEECMKMLTHIATEKFAEIQKLEKEESDEQQKNN